MVIKDLKELQKLIQLCRKEGIASIEIDNIKLTLGSKPSAYKQPRGTTQVFPEADIKIPQYNGITNPNVAQAVADTIETDGLTEEQLMYFSSASEAQ